MTKYLANAVKKKVSTSMFSKGYSRALDSFLREFASSNDVQQCESGGKPAVSRTNPNNATCLQDREKGIVRKHDYLSPHSINFSCVVQSLQFRAKTQEKQHKDKTIKTKMGSPSKNLWLPSKQLSVENYDQVDSINSNLRPPVSSSFLGCPQCPQFHLMTMVTTKVENCHRSRRKMHTSIQAVYCMYQLAWVMNLMSTL